VEITWPDACTEALPKSGNRMMGELDTYPTGTLVGAGSFRCSDCGFAVALNALDGVPRCPNCGNARFARASLFDTRRSDAAPTLGDSDGGDSHWIETVRQQIEEEPGHYLAYRDDDGRVSVLPLVGEWIRIGRSLTADIRFDDPTVSRRHAIIVCQHGGPRVLDDRSLNGVFLDGERVEWGELDDGAELIIGRYRLFFLDSARASAEIGARGDRAAA
jgi:DNA-directed RNA polymerase subunit RPC12/RpoP